MIIVLTGCQ